MSRTTFVNLPVLDLDRAVEFFTDLGFDFDPRFTDENAGAMTISDLCSVMLLRQPFFSTFTDKQVATESVTEVAIALSAKSRDEVDTLVDRAVSLGAAPSGETQDQGFMYGRSFHDLDGHLWEFIWMDPAVATG